MAQSLFGPLLIVNVSGRVLASYTWSKSILDGLDDNTSYTTDPYHEYGNNDRGVDEEDRRSGLSLSSLVVLPYGFRLSGIVGLLTGPPWNITYGKDFDGDGNTQDRPAGLSKDIGGRARAFDLSIINAARSSYQSTTLPSGLAIPALNPAGSANPSSEPAGTCLNLMTMAELNQNDGIRKIDVRSTKGFNFGESDAVWKRSWKRTTSPHAELSSAERSDQLAGLPGAEHSR